MRHLVNDLADSKNSLNPVCHTFSRKCQSIQTTPRANKPLHCIIRISQNASIKNFFHTLVVLYFVPKISKIIIYVTL